MQESRSTQIKEQFKVRRSRQIWAIVPVIPALLIALCSGKEGPGVTVGGLRLMPLAVAIVVAVLLFSFWSWRCPSCGGYLGKTINPKSCPKCGVELR